MNIQQDCKYYPIGAVFKHNNGKYYKVIEDKGMSSICTSHCSFTNKSELISKCESRLACLAKVRSDDTNVHFKKISKEKAVEHLLVGGK